MAKCYPGVCLWNKQQNTTTNNDKNNKDSGERIISFQRHQFL
jgi:hypothetical protein